MLFWIFTAVSAVSLYVFVIRPRIRHLPAFEGWFDRVERWERILWGKSRTIFLSRLVALGGIVTTAAESVDGANIDWHSIALSFVQWLPENYQPLGTQLMIPLAFLALGGAFEWLRHVTREPLDRKE